MPLTIFFSWQSDSSSSINKNFIEDALRRAVKSIAADADVEEALREEQLVIDKDTKGVPGSPPIVDVIFDKISKCGIFVPDLTFVGTAPNGRKLPNPNVLIEYGWALRSLGHSRLIPVMNVAGGEPTSETMPFDMRHLRFPLTYSLTAESSAEERRRVKDELTKSLTRAIKEIFMSGHLEAVIPKPPPFKEVEPQWGRSSFLREGDRLVTLKDDFGFNPPKDCFLEFGPHMYLRLIPTSDAGQWTPFQLMELATKPNVTALPMGSRSSMDFNVNQFGFVVCCIDASNNKTPRVVQFFKNGEIWAINASSLRHYDGGQKKLLYPMDYEPMFINSLESYRRFALEKLRIKPPYKWIAGMCGIENREIVFPPPPPGRVRLHNSGGQCVEDQIESSGEIGSDDDVSNALLPFFRKIWETCGFSMPTRN